MLKNRHTQDIRLYESVKKNVGEQEANRLSENICLPKSSSDARKFSWAETICSYLEENFEEDKIKDIRMNSCCKPNLRNNEESKKRYEQAGSLERYAELQRQAGENTWVENDAIYIAYPVCYCPTVKKVDKPLTRTWCYCTLGHTKAVNEYIFGCEVKVELIQSIKTGSNRCVIKTNLCGNKETATGANGIKEINSKKL